MREVDSSFDQFHSGNIPSDNYAECIRKTGLQLFIDPSAFLSSGPEAAKAVEDLDGEDFPYFNEIIYAILLTLFSI
jgi:hypothetical protein